MSEPFPEVTLESDRLILRPYRLEDAPDVQLACNDPEIQRWVPLPTPYDDEVARSWVSDLSHRPRLAGTGVTFAVLSKETGRLVAGFALIGVDARSKTAEIGYWVAPWARRMGYAVEATRRLAAYGFTELGLGRLELLVEPANGASHRVAVKAGCAPEGLRVSALMSRTGRVDVAVWRLLPDTVFPLPRLLPDAAERSDGEVVVRPLQPGDVDGVCAERTDPEYLRWLAVVTPADRPYTDVIRERLAETEWRWLSGQAAGFAVVDAATGSYAGSVEVYLDRPEWRTATLGYATHPGFRRRGFMRRALPLVAGWAFDEAGLARLEAGVAAGNVGSQRTAEAAGFRREGVLRGAQPLPAGRSDMVLYGMLPQDR